MNVETNQSKSVDEFDDEIVDSVDDDPPEETAVLIDAEVTDNVGDVSVELNVEELIAEVEAEKNQDAARKKEIRQRLEEIAEAKSFEDTYAIDMNDEES